MMLRVEWDDTYNRDKNNNPIKLRGTVTGYVYGPQDTHAVVLRDQRRSLLSLRLSQLTPIGWRREHEIT